MAEEKKKVPFFSSEKDRLMDEKLQKDFYSTEGRARRRKGIRCFFCIMLVLTLIVAGLNWGIISNWGNVKIERLTLSGYNGDKISALLYRPKNATNETPAPLLVCTHGNAGNARNHESWAVEFARRGFVVVSIDLFGSGDSDNSTSSLMGLDSLTSVADVVYQHALTFDYVDKDNIVVGGHSMGTMVAVSLAAKYDAKCLLGVSGRFETYFDTAEGGEEYAELVKQYVGDVLVVYGDVERTEEAMCAEVQQWLDGKAGYYDGYEGITYTAKDTIVGSFEEGNAVVGMLNPNRVHEAAFVNEGCIESLLWFAQESIGDAVPNYIDPSDQVWQYKDFIGLIGIYVFGLFICSIALLLIEEIPFFEDVKRPVPRNIGLRKQGLLISIILGVIFPYIVLKSSALGLLPLIGMEGVPDQLHPIAGLKLTYSNVAFCTLIGFNLLGLIGFALYFFTDGKKHKLTPSDLGLTPVNSNRASGKMIGKTALLAVIVVAIAWGFISLQEALTGTDFYAWFFGFKGIPMSKVNHYWVYIIGWIICFVVASFTINIERRLPSTGKEGLDIVIAMIFNIVAASFTLIVAIVVNWTLSSNGIKDTPWIWTFGTDITRLWGMPAGMAVGVGGSTLLFRKTGNTWLSAILMGTVAALMCVTFGQLRMY